MPSYMNCPDCGYPVEKSASFCPKCFAPIEPPGFWQRFLSLFRGGRSRRDRIVDVKQDIIVDVTDEQGRQHEYHSLDEVPPEVRAEIEKLKAEPWKEVSRFSSADGFTKKIVREKRLSTYKIVDESGKEQIYHSLEEMPPELRAAIEEAERTNPAPGSEPPPSQG